jgi:hypothetical protein
VSILPNSFLITTPTALVAVAISSTSIKLTWKDHAIDETKYWV